MKQIIKNSNPTAANSQSYRLRRDFVGFDGIKEQAH